MAEEGEGMRTHQLKYPEGVTTFGWRWVPGPRDTLFRIIGVVLVVVVVGLFFTFADILDADPRYEYAWTRTSGLVYASIPDYSTCGRSGFNHASRYAYQYTDAKGQTYTQTTYPTCFAYYVGEPLIILYDPADPTHQFIETATYRLYAQIYGYFDPAVRNQ